MSPVPIAAVVLAGERPGGNAVAQACGLAAGVLAEVAGQACITRVLRALRASTAVDGGLVVGPDREICASAPLLQELFATGDFLWQAAQTGPSASALDAIKRLDRFPLLLTAGDHALLTADIVDEFCRDASALDAACVVGLVPYATVLNAYPDTRRTRLRFRNGSYCGSNLFLLKRRDAARVVEFWGALEADRKRPWRIAARLGALALLRYLCGRLTVADAFAQLSRRSGVKVDFVSVLHARAAIDVDSMADLELAREIARHD